MPRIIFATTRAPVPFRDEFPGAIRPRIWPTRVDTGAALTPSAGRLSVEGGAGTWGNPRLVQRPKTRAAFGGIVGSVRIRGVSVLGPLIGYAASASPSFPTGVAGVYFDFSGVGQHWKIATTNVIATKPGTNVRSIDHQIAVIPRPGGGNWVFVSGGVYGTWPTGTLLWVDDTEAGDPLYALLANSSGTWSADFVQILRVGQLPPAFTTRYGPASAGDTFTRADGGLAGTISEVGALTWTVTGPGTPTIAANVVNMGTGNNNAYLTPSTQPRIIQCTFNTAATGGIFGGLLFRVNADGRYMLFNISSTIFTIYEIGTGGAGILTQAGASIANGTAYRLTVIDWGTHIRTLVNGADVFGILTATAFSNTSTGVGFQRTTPNDNGSTFDDLVTWNATYTLPTVVRVPLPPNGIGAALISDTFTDADATNLATHVPDSGGSPWQVNSGSMQINANKARVNAAATLGIATLDSGNSDHEVSADITTPTTSPVWPIDWFAAVIARYTDANNYLFARFLYQTNAPEIELYNIIDGVSNLLAFIQLNTGNLLPNTTYNLRFAVVGSQIAAYFNNETTPAVQGATTLLAGTRVGIGVVSAGFLSGQPSWDNFLVKAAV